MKCCQKVNFSVSRIIIKKFPVRKSISAIILVLSIDGILKITYIRRQMLSFKLLFTESKILYAALCMSVDLENVSALVFRNWVDWIIQKQYWCINDCTLYQAGIILPYPHGVNDWQIFSIKSLIIYLSTKLPSHPHYSNNPQSYLHLQ